MAHILLLHACIGDFYLPQTLFGLDRGVSFEEMSIVLNFHSNEIKHGEKELLKRTQIHKN